MTAEGVPCQRWDTQSPHTHPFIDPRWFPDESLRDAANYCRNPDGDGKGPWCYTTDASQYWSYCHILTCEEQVLEDSTVLMPPLSSTPADCGEIRDAGIRVDGVYIIDPGRTGEFAVYCDLSEAQNDEATSGGWTVFHRRMDDTDFNRAQSEFVEGFGDLTGSHWLGLTSLHRMTSAYDVVMHVTVEDYDGNRATALYESFSVGNSSTNYRLAISGYSGNAGDAMTSCNNTADQMVFSFAEQYTNSAQSHCARFFGSWWYNDCHCGANPTGVYGGRGVPSFYGEGLAWSTFSDFTLKSITMKLKRSH